jgi:hypothetical protein
MHLLQEYNKKYLRYADYNHSAGSLSKSFYNNYLALSAIGNDTCANDVPHTSQGTPP